jgi:hypothetical protein
MGLIKVFTGFTSEIGYGASVYESILDDKSAVCLTESKGCFQ